MKWNQVFLFMAASLSGIFSVTELVAQTEIVPVKSRYIYSVGEPAKIEIRVRDPKKNTWKDSGTCKVTIRRDSGTMIEEKEFDLSKGNPFQFDVTLNEPGFVWISANGQLSGIGFDPEKIRQGIPEPEDFDSYWNHLLKEQAAIPDPVKLEALPDSVGVPGYDYYKLTITTLGNQHTYGFLGVPKGKKGPFSAYVQVIAAGPGYDGPDPKFVRPDMLTLALNVHGFDPADAKTAFNKDYPTLGAGDRDTYYFRNAVLGTVTAVNYLASRKDFNGDMIYLGVSQGGGFGIILAALTDHFKAVAVGVPALCNHGGYRNGNGSGWPFVVSSVAKEDKTMEEKVSKASSYYDAANFAKRVKCPILFSVGFIDSACRPSSVYAAYNNVTAPKWIINKETEGHGVGWEALDGLWQWAQNPLPDEFRFHLPFYRY